MELWSKKLQVNPEDFFISKGITQCQLHPYDEPLKTLGVIKPLARVRAFGRFENLDPYPLKPPTLQKAWRFSKPLSITNPHSPKGRVPGASLVDDEIWRDQVRSDNFFQWQTIDWEYCALLHPVEGDWTGCWGCRGQWWRGLKLSGCATLW